MPVARIRPQDLVSPADNPAHEVPDNFWTGAENVNFREGYAQRVQGWTEIYGSATNPPLHVLNSLYSGTNYWLYGTEDNIYVADISGTHFDITPTTAPSGAVPETYTSCTLNGVPVINFQLDPPVWWDRSTATAMQALPNWYAGESCSAMRSFKFYLFAIGISGGVTGLDGSYVRWSDAAAPGAVPGTWVPAAGNDAGFLSLGGTSESCIDAQQIRDQLMVCKGHSTYLLQYIGGNNIISQREFLSTTGVLATNCMAEARGQAFILADGDILVTDGNQVDSLIDRKTRRTLFAALDQTNYGNSFVVNNQNRNEIWFCYPENGQEYATRALVFDLNTGRFAEKDQLTAFGGLAYRDTLTGGSGLPHAAQGNITEDAVADTWDLADGNWDTWTVTWNSTVVQAANDGLVGCNWDDTELALLDSQDGSSDSGSITSQVLRESLDFGDQQQMKLVSWIRPRITGNAGDIINVRAGSQMNPDDPIEWSQFVAYTIGQDEKVDTFAHGRFISFEFSSTDQNVWRLSGFDVNLEPTGQY